MEIEHNISMIVNADSSYFDPMSTLSRGHAVDEYLESMSIIEEYFKNVANETALKLQDKIENWYFYVEYLSMTSMHVTCDCCLDMCPIVEEIQRLWSDDSLVFDIFYGKNAS